MSIVVAHGGCSTVPRTAEINNEWLETGFWSLEKTQAIGGTMVQWEKASYWCQMLSHSHFSELRCEVTTTTAEGYDNDSDESIKTKETN